MLTVESAVEHLKEAQAELERLDEDRATLTEMVRVYEKFIAGRGGSVGKTNGKLNSAPIDDPFKDVPLSQPSPSTTKAEAVKQIIKAAQGADLHPREMVARLHAQGIEHKVDPKQPWRHGLDFILYRLLKEDVIEKSPGKPGYWRWKLEHPFVLKVQ
jgi:hypothetical protein